MNQNIEPGIRVVGDRDRLVRMVTILMDNALKYVDKDGVIDIKLKSYPDYVGLTITNTGIPIPLEKQSQVFGRFFRADESRADSGKGYGLGLPIANNIAANHGGIIKLLYSDWERGTCFSVKLPHEGDANLMNFQFIPTKKQKKSKIHN